MNPATIDYAKTGVRRLLVVDDQPHIHDTFDRIFQQQSSADGDLADFEARFLNSAAAPSAHDVESPNEMPAYELNHASGCDQAVALMQAAVSDGQRFSVAFVDMKMPQGPDGIETTRRLWELDERLQIVICTAHSDRPWKDVLQQLGYNDRLLLLKKPFESDEVRQLALSLSEKYRLSAIRTHQINELQTEVSLRRSVEDELREMAQRDNLTRLPNRCFLLQQLEKIIQKHRRNVQRLDAVLFLDLDNFKIINDSLGHDAGDLLLNEVASRLKECVRDYDLLTRFEDQQRFCDQGEETMRLGGDEFVVVLECLGGTDDAMRVAQRIVKRVAEPFKLGDRWVNVGTSVGVAFVDAQIRDAHEALRNADTAMYRAKTSGRGRVAVFDKSMHAAVCARLEMEEQLRRAVDHGDFRLLYQPIVDLANGRIKGVETLLRWQNERGVNVSPDEFVPVMEEVGLISAVGEWVIRESTTQFGGMLQRLPDSIRDTIYLGVNLSSRQLNDQSFLRRLLQILDETGFDRRRFKLEMRETADQRSGARALAGMQSLNQSGIGIHIDDFGKGQSSLLCFQAYPVETVKIDRSFTAQIVSDNSHAVITRAVIQLAHQLGARIVAEGVESEQQMSLLRRWGCNMAQGYFFAPPLSLEDLERLIVQPTRSTGVKSLIGDVGGIFYHDGQPIVSGIS
ncbi:putative bifunctional diguanylate cyclase/phosphodiesterase [Crateriforma conspicua]|uniref:putative bifunctional diguanylate cyclase/phosphodiesterase n=1 Tax=Crateriforma conspicua TaxID=2527996 RepID=UPI00118C3597|nr:EAL domain-containing protein [Crateriforma conspicua]QDV61504.1 Cyclic di-GMP phosphodiesterase Gmr [Crateriforma conspicua]